MNIRKSLSKDAENQKKMTTEEGYEFKKFLETSTYPLHGVVGSFDEYR